MIDLRNTLFVYINLDHCIDRKEYMESMLSSMKLNYVRFSAIKPTRESLIEGDYNSFYDRSVKWLKLYLNSDEPKFNKLSLGTFGCYLSHYFILKKYSSSYSSIIILEDDVKFNIPNLKKFFRIASNVKCDDIDLCRPLYGGLEDNDFLSEISSSIYEFNYPYKHSIFVENLKGHNYFGATHFVYYHNINRVLDFLDSERVFNIDAIFSTNYLNSFLLSSCMIYQNRTKFESDIGSFNSLKN